MTGQILNKTSQSYILSLQTGMLYSEVVNFLTNLQHFRDFKEKKYEQNGYRNCMVVSAKGAIRKIPWCFGIIIYEGP